jgi:Met-10+ like-protein
MLTAILTPLTSGQVISARFLWEAANKRITMLKTKTKIRAAASLSRGIGAIRRLAGLSENVVTVRRRALWWHLDLREAIDFTIYLFGAWEGSTVRSYQKVIQPGMVVLDIGANVGAHTLPLAQLVGPAGQVYSFEPTLYAFEKLQKNLSLNRALASRVIAEQMMLTDCGGECEAEIYSSWEERDFTGNIWVSRS